MRLAPHHREQFSRALERSRAAGDREHAPLRAGDLRANGLDVVPGPRADLRGHAELPDLTYKNRREDAAEEAQQLLARKLCRKILGPLP